MQTIKLGPAGNCLMEKGEKTIDSLRNLKKIYLTAQEIEFVRNVYMNNKQAKDVGDFAKKIGIELSIHSSYYINLLSEDSQKIKDSKRRILDSCERGHFFGTKENPCRVVFHPGYYGKLSKQNAYDLMKRQFEEINESIKKNNWNSVLAPETSGKHSAFGTLDETIALASELRLSMCTDLAHLYAKNMGKINFSEVLDKLEAIKVRPLHFHFSGINYSEKGELNHLPVNNNPSFEPFAKEILERRISATIISESPITWEDSLKMKKIFEKLGYRF